MLVNGVDMIEILRIRRVAAQYGERFLNRIYTDQEQRYCRGRASQLATRFAAKEAVMKALGTGIRGVPWKEVEVVRRPGRAPTIVLHGKASQQAKRMGIEQIAVSLTHSKDFAIAFVVAESTSPNF
jgi:holo-[acyl-carrier protein] synthase